MSSEGLTIGYFYCSGFGKNNTEQSCCLNCLQVPSRVGPRLPATLTASSGPGPSSRLTGCHPEGESVVPSTCESGSSPNRATLVQKLPFVSAVTNCKFGMLWVSDTHTTHSCKQLTASRKKTKAGGQGSSRGSNVEASLPPSDGPLSALSREETVSW